MNDIMFPSSKNFRFSKQQKSYVKTVYKKLVLNRSMMGNLVAIWGTELDSGWLETEMIELHTTIIDLQAELNMLKHGVIRCQSNMYL